MAESFIQVAPDGAGKKMDTFTVVAPDGGTQHREAVVVADADMASATQKVTGGGQAITHDEIVEDLLTQVLIELRVLNCMLRETQGSRDDLDSLRAAEAARSLQTTQ